MLQAWIDDAAKTDVMDMIIKGEPASGWTSVDCREMKDKGDC